MVYILGMAQVPWTDSANLMHSYGARKSHRAEEGLRDNPVHQIDCRLDSIQHIVQASLGVSRCHQWGSCNNHFWHGSGF